MNAPSFLDAAEGYRKNGWRLMMISASSELPSEIRPDGMVDLIWSFEREGTLEHLREQVAVGEEVPSISTLFPSAFLYENEIRDLFGVAVSGMTVDFKGQLYRTAKKFPMSPRAIKARLEAGKDQ